MRAFPTGKQRRFEIFFVTVNEPYEPASDVCSEYTDGDITGWLDKKNEEIRRQKGSEFAKAVIVHLEPVTGEKSNSIAEA